MSGSCSTWWATQISIHEDKWLYKHVNTKCQKTIPLTYTLNNKTQPFKNALFLLKGQIIQKVQTHVKHASKTTAKLF